MFRKLLPSILSLSTVFLLNTAAYSLDSVDEYDKKVEEQKKKIERVQEGIKGHSSKVTTSEKEETNLIDHLESLEDQIDTEGKKLIHLKQKVEIQDQATQRQQQEVEHLLVQKNTLQQHTENRLTAYYKTGDIGFINVIFSSSSLSDLVSFRDKYHLMLRHDQQNIHSYKDKIKELNESRAAHEEEKRKLNETIAKAEEQQKILADTKIEREVLLKRVVTEKKLYQQAIEEMESAASSLKEALERHEQERLEAKQEEEYEFIKGNPLKAFKKRRPLHLHGFAGHKGTLPPPASGSVVKYFGEENRGKFDIPVISNGISIKTAPGSDIKAIYAGKIVYAGSLRGYGKLVIIDHGNHYFTLTSDVGHITKKTNEPVVQGERIATSSLHSGHLNDGFRFEIRFNTEPQDPLLWLDQTSRELSVKNNE